MASTTSRWFESRDAELQEAGKERKVFFDIVKAASESLMIDLSVKKLGLIDLMDSEFAGGGLD